MQAAVALVVVLVAQLGFWALLHARFFLAALVANGLFWCVAFPAWTEAARRWWRTSPTPDVALSLMLIAPTVCAYLAAAKRADRDRRRLGLGRPVQLSGVADCAALATLRAARRAAALTGRNR